MRSVDEGCYRHSEEKGALVVRGSEARPAPWRKDGIDHYLLYTCLYFPKFRNNMIFYHQKKSVYIFFFVCLYGRKEKAGPSWMGRLGHLQSNRGVRLKMEDCPVFLASWCSALKPGGEAGCGEGPFRKTL